MLLYAFRPSKTIMRRSANQPKIKNKIVVLFAVILFFLALFHEPVLNYLAGRLVYKDDIKPSDAIVVLTGDETGDRLMAGISLFKKGYGKKIVFWGGPVYWKITYAELFSRLLKENGIGSEAAIWSDERLVQNSTQGEALVNIRLLKAMGARSFILVTSDYHTMRARSVYVPLAGKNGMTMYVFPAHDSDVELKGWWKDRQSAKMVLMEFEKTVWYKLFQ